MIKAGRMGRRILNTEILYLEMIKACRVGRRIPRMKTKRPSITNLKREKCKLMIF